MPQGTYLFQQVPSTSGDSEMKKFELLEQGLFTELHNQEHTNFGSHGKDNRKAISRIYLI
jgi:hypothetical protein